MGDTGIETDRLVLRAPGEDDRARFVELFTDPAFMVFHVDGVDDRSAAHERFDAMVERCAELPYAKQAVIERATGRVVGYTGVDWYEGPGGRALELGYRLEPAARGKGYATEAAQAIVGVARQASVHELHGLVHADNAPSRNVMAKLGFELVGEVVIGGSPTLLHVLRLA